MRVAIAGAGNVGRSIAGELLENGHKVLLLDRDPGSIDPTAVPGAEWVLADACEVTTLEEAGISTCDVMIAATGDDKVNLVVSLLSKTEFGVNRVVGRINHPKNEWLFTDAWGVDVAVSSPRVLAALVEEAVSVGDLVRLMSFRQGQANLVEITLGEDAAHVGRPISDLDLPQDAALVAVLRGKRVMIPTPDNSLEAGDELLFLATDEAEDAVHRMLSAG